MADVFAREPLISNADFSSSKKERSFITFARWALQGLMWAVFVAWIGYAFLYPTELGTSLSYGFIGLTGDTVFGHAGSVFLLFSSPVVVMVVLAFIYLAAFPRNNFKKTEVSRFRLWTFPVLTSGPFGVVTAAELIGIFLFAAYVLWAFVIYYIQAYSTAYSSQLSMKEISYYMIEVLGLRLGSIGLFLLSFLFLPVARGSVLLRLIDIPFEHATRYHVWLGHLTMAIFTLHGLFFVTLWSMEGILLAKLTEWESIGISNLPGVISLCAGLLMWVTSLKYVRNNYFEVFYYTHQLYIVFVVFLALHIGDFIFCIAVGAIFLFFLDRFLRFCQSRATVDIISASCRPCGTIELIISKPANLSYNALNFIFIQVKELSWMQWHPFSVSSSPLDGPTHMTILIKVLGKWTQQLRDIIKTQNITASVEGPYGHESPNHLMYENLILVAGGIGITPFLAILSDIFHRVNEKKPCLAKKILVIWAVKTSAELSLLSAVNLKTLNSSVFNKLQLEIQCYVTQETEAPLEEGKIPESTSTMTFPTGKKNTMSCLVGTGSNFWPATYFLVSTLGFIASYGLMSKFYLIPFGITTWWYKGLLFMICMIMSVIVFGGIVVILWHVSEKRASRNEACPIQDENESDDICDEKLENFQTVRYGSRPYCEDIFYEFGKGLGNVDIGVFVCGPTGLETCVAKACRAQYSKGKWNHPVYHFNSHSFEL